jgi:hypothetical protein
MNTLNINSIDELIKFVNREDVSKEDALTVAQKCFGVKAITFGNRETGEATYTKEKIIEQIHKSANDGEKHIWLMCK